MPLIHGDRAPDVITGFSEWAGAHGKSSLSIGWDWGLVRNMLVVLNPAEIRTINDSVAKSKFDNIYGCRESLCG